MRRAMKKAAETKEDVDPDAPDGMRLLRRRCCEPAEVSSGGCAGSAPAKPAEEPRSGDFEPTA